MLDPATVQILFADLQPPIAARSKANPPQSLSCAAAVLAQCARLLGLPVTQYDWRPYHSRRSFLRRRGHHQHGERHPKREIYVAAFAPDTGESVAALLRRFPGSTAEANTTAPILLADGSRDLYIQPEKFRVQYAADLPETESKVLALTQRPSAERATTEVSDVAAWKATPSWFRFIFGTRDNSIPVNLLAFLAERAGSKKTVTIEGASHAVMISHADAVAELLEQAALAV